MFGRALANATAATPYGVKRTFRWLKPAYISVIQLGKPVVTVQTAAGTLRWRVDGLTSQRHLLGTYEEFMQQAFLRFVRPGGVVYDIGAHAGFHSLYCALLVRPGGMVVAFEPDPVACKSLETQVRENPELSVQVIACALSNRSGRLLMDTSAGTSQTKVAAQGDIEVEANTVDDLVHCGRIAPPTVLKIDVEGYEGSVLQGSRATLQKYRPVVLCDYNEGDTLLDVIKLLSPLGYVVSPGPPVTAVLGRTDPAND